MTISTAEDQQSDRNGSESLTRPFQCGSMIDCDELLDDLSHQTRQQLELAVLAEAAPVAAMHLDLALLAGERTRVAEELCSDDDVSIETEQTLIRAVEWS